jgi:hypothetical protein
MAVGSGILALFKRSAIPTRAAWIVGRFQFGFTGMQALQTRGRDAIEPDF